MTLAILLWIVAVQAAFVGWRITSRAARQDADSSDAAQIESLAREISNSVSRSVASHSNELATLSHELRDAIEKGGTTQLVDRTVERILQANGSLQTQLTDAEAKLSELRRRLAETESVALTDPLTGLANRRSFDAHMEKRMAEWARLRHPFSLILFDVDHFKKFNDRYGHPAGDALLKHLAKTCVGTLRDMDVTVRYGGEEFAAILPGTKLELAQIAAERLRNAVAKHTLEFGGNTLAATISVGLAEVAADDSLAGLIGRVDEALYAAKHAGRNRTYINCEGTCRPVINETPRPIEPKPSEAVRSETPNPVDKRSSERRKYAGAQRIAEYYGGSLPPSDSFFEIECGDISKNGVTLYSVTSLPFTNFILELGTPTKPIYVWAEVVHSKRCKHNGGDVVRIGCRFRSRIGEGAPSLPALEKEPSIVSSRP